MSCAGDNGDCPEPVEAAGLCAGHRQRAKRNEPINTPLRDYGDPWMAFDKAIHRYVETNGFDRDAFERAKANLRMAAKRWLSEGWHMTPKRKSPAPKIVPKPTDS